MDKMNEGVQNMQISSYKITKSWGNNVQHSEYHQQYYIVHLEVAKRVDLKRFYQRKNICNCMVTDVRLLLIISQCIQILTHCVVHLKQI